MTLAHFPYKRVLILFFDTETTGLPLNWKRPVTDSENWPRLVQIAWLLFDDQGEELRERCSIVYPQNFDIPEEAAAVHGITTEMAMEKGEHVEDLLLEFEKDLNSSEVVVAHNMSFDERIYLAEMFRAGYESCFESKTRLCTMRASTRLCAIPDRYGRGFKWPKLSELHLKLFGEDFEGAHDALADIRACSRCYWEMRRLHWIT